MAKKKSTGRVLVVAGPQFGPTGNVTGWALKVGKSQTVQGLCSKTKKDAQRALNRTVKDFLEAGKSVDLKLIDSDGKSVVQHVLLRANQEPVELSKAKPAAERKARAAKTEAKAEAVKPAAEAKSGKRGAGLAKYRRALKAYKKAHPELSHAEAVAAMKGGAAPAKAKTGGKRGGKKTESVGAIGMPSAATVAKAKPANGRRKKTEAAAEAKPARAKRGGKKADGEKTKRAPSAYNLFVKSYMSKHKLPAGASKEQRGQQMTDAATAWQAKK